MQACLSSGFGLDLANGSHEPLSRGGCIVSWLLCALAVAVLLHHRPQLLSGGHSPLATDITRFPEAGPLSAPQAWEDHGFLPVVVPWCCIALTGP